jgi:ribonuclease BN (tRNA processing enzyme)
MSHSTDDGLFFVGNATTVIRYGGFTLLTDPNFLRRGQLAYLGWGLSTRRLRDPAISIDELPDLDAIVLSHLHGDHWDRVASRRLDRDLPIVTTRPRRAGCGCAGSAVPGACWTTYESSSADRRSRSEPAMDQNTGCSATSYAASARRQYTSS